MWCKLEDIASFGGWKMASMNIKLSNYHFYINILRFFPFIIKEISKFALNINYLIMEPPKNLNRLKAVLADAGQTNKWLAEQLGKDPVTVSKWCTNTTQPDLQTLARISELLKVNIRELLVDSSNW